MSDRAEGEALLAEMLSDEPRQPSPQPMIPAGHDPNRPPQTPHHQAATAAEQAAQQRAGVEQYIAQAQAAQRQQEYEHHLVSRAAQAAAAAMAQVQQQAPPGGYDPNADPYTAEAVRQEVSRAVAGINEQLASYSRNVEAFNRGQINEQLNLSEQRARAQHGDAAVDAALRMATERGANGAYVMRADAYGDLMRDFTEVGRQHLGSDRDFFHSMFERKPRA